MPTYQCVGTLFYGEKLVYLLGKFGELQFFLKPEEHRLDLGFRCVVENPTGFTPFCEKVQITGYPGERQGKKFSSNGLFDA